MPPWLRRTLWTVVTLAFVAYNVWRQEWWRLGIIAAFMLVVGLLSLLPAPKVEWVPPWMRPNRAGAQVAFQELSRQIGASRRAFLIEHRTHYALTADANRPWQPDWLHRIAEVTAAGVVVQHVRVVDGPDDLDWAGGPGRAEASAGADVRCVRRADLDGIRLPEHDFWLLDDDRLLWSVTDDDGRHRGFRADSAAGWAEVRDAVWAQAGATVE